MFIRVWGESVGEAYINISVSGGNLRRGHFYIPRDSFITPADAWGGSNGLSAGQPVRLFFEGTNESVSTDIAGDKRIFRYARGETLRFYLYHEIKEMDTICLVRVSERHLVVRYDSEKQLQTIEPGADGTAESHLGMRLSSSTQETTIDLWVKTLYCYQCQVCGLSLPTFAGPYAESAHIRPVGAPHNGADTLSNILCLCPNHRVMFDNGGFVIGDDLSLKGIGGWLYVHSDHPLDLAQIAYHRALWAGTK